MLWIWFPLPYFYAIYILRVVSFQASLSLQKAGFFFFLPQTLATLSSPTILYCPFCFRLVVWCTFCCAVIPCLFRELSLRACGAGDPRKPSSYVFLKHQALGFIGNYTVCELPLKSIGKSFNILSNYYLRRIFPKRITGESF